MALPAQEPKYPDRMLTNAQPSERGIRVEFADGCEGVIPFADIPEVGSFERLAGLQLNNPYEIVLESSDGEIVELPWDFARAYCDAAYRKRVESTAAAGRAALGERLRRLRKAARLTQEELASAAGVECLTVGRIESGDDSPRYETIVTVADALGVDPTDLLVEPAP
jgi:DNA-binding XRE family transcriptional regulator